MTVSAAGGLRGRVVAAARDLQRNFTVRNYYVGVSLEITNYTMVKRVDNEFRAFAPRI